MLQSSSLWVNKRCCWFGCLFSGLAFYCSVMLFAVTLVFAYPAGCPKAIPQLRQSISKSRWPTCARHRSDMSALISVTFHSLFYFSDSLLLPAQIRDVVFKHRVAECLCVLTYTGRLGEACPQKPEQHEHGAGSAPGSHGSYNIITRNTTALLLFSANICCHTVIMF